MKRQIHLVSALQPESISYLRFQLSRHVVCVPVEHPTARQKDCGVGGVVPVLQRFASQDNDNLKVARNSKEERPPLDRSIGGP